jgi:hypothetical protein
LNGVIAATPNAEPMTNESVEKVNRPAIIARNESMLNPRIMLTVSRSI